MPIVSTPASTAVASTVTTTVASAVSSAEPAILTVLALLLMASAAATTLMSEAAKTSTVLAVSSEVAGVPAETLLVRLLGTALASGVLRGRSWTTLLGAQHGRAGTALSVTERL
jgi:hypothetical protein